MLEIKYSEKGQLPKEAVFIRTKVFVEEQKFEEEFDSIDNESIHMLVYKDGQAIATGRIFWQDEGTMRIGRIAVLQEFRKFGLGKAVLGGLCDKSVELGADYAILGAQTRAKGFYEKYGFTTYGEEYFEEYCPHIMMRKKLGV